MAVPQPKGFIDDEFINVVKILIEHVNEYGKTIQDLVADGQLTEEQYAELITMINGLIKSGHVDKSDLTPEFKDEIEGFSVQLAQKATKEEVEKVPVNILSKKYTQKRTASFNPIIVAYGDSNTRYHEGDKGSDGSVSLAYSTEIDKLTMDYPNYHGSVVINAGYSGRTIQYGLDNYMTNVTNNNANIVIVGFGTNDIKREERTLEQYLSRMEEMIDRLLSDNIVPIILGIPWYDSNYAPGTESRLPIWNEALMKLCIGKNVEFIDVYKMFQADEADVWFNEKSTSKRHYSIMAQKVLGEEIFKRILALNSTTPIQNAYKQETFNGSTISWFEEKNTNPDFRYFIMGGNSISALAIAEGETISFRAQGRFVLGFYPRADATIELDGYGEFEIEGGLYNGLYYPVHKISDPNNFPNESAQDIKTVTLTVKTGTAYLRYIGSELSPRTYTSYEVIERVLKTDDNYEIYADGTVKAWGIRTITGLSTSRTFGPFKRNSGGNYATSSSLTLSEVTYANFHVVDAPTFGIAINASHGNPPNFQLAFDEDLNDATVKVAWEFRGYV